jgi:8-oxo-dGTP diphosphatase
MIIDVTCAIIINRDRTLVVQRSENMKLPLKWEFPGGKLESNETEEECIVREIKEELNLEIEVKFKLTPSEHHYPELTIRLIPFVAELIGGEINLSEHKQYLFLDKEELSKLDWAEADLPILKEYLAL